MLKFVIPLAGLLFAGCAQDYGGITKLNYDAETGDVSYISGKEAATVMAEQERQPDGTVIVKVEAGEVQAFEGQQIQADRIVGLADAITPTVENIVIRLICAYAPASPGCLP